MSIEHRVAQRFQTRQAAKVAVDASVYIHQYRKGDHVLTVDFAARYYVYGADGMWVHQFAPMLMDGAKYVEKVVNDAAKATSMSTSKKPEVWGFSGPGPVGKLVLREAKPRFNMDREIASVGTSQLVRWKLDPEQFDFSVFEERVKKMASYFGFKVERQG